jgi:hypothetical protein
MGFSFAPFGESAFFRSIKSGRSNEDLYGRAFTPPPSPYASNPNFEINNQSN